jgi:hypothetical protein
MMIDNVFQVLPVKTRVVARIMILAVSVFLSGCNLGEKEAGSCKFHVIAYGGGFSGWYITDNDDPVPFAVDTAEDGAYIYSKQLETPSSSICVFAQALTDSTSSISIMVYDDSDLLASNSEYKVEDESLINEVTYTDFADDDTEE